MLDVMNALDTDLTAVVAEQPDPLLFATVSGAHLCIRRRRTRSWSPWPPQC